MAEHTSRSIVAAGEFRPRNAYPLPTPEMDARHSAAKMNARFPSGYSPKFGRENNGVPHLDSIRSTDTAA
ncbi:hypothetical protein H7J08_30050 [Mycobacterium frederiksbergense]|uniref:hypothetical protein n=1 Tax=Mycolicibacterium frederiksbergense TaxID=117567 RepID=UPI0021F354C2|nr:hypothetical protein [Mycolicibacterium frederiksbergense]MCV7048878.1 hypothetical protein [Mycolicibacterium frederiksbergense]